MVDIGIIWSIYWNYFQQWINMISIISQYSSYGLLFSQLCSQRPDIMQEQNNSLI